VLMVGAKFGVAMVMDHGRRIEVATFRDDLSYSDGRRPDSVRFCSARQDALRRDFTINGMFYDPLGDEVVDYVDGRKDLAAGVIRAIGDADRRFAEDYLRMLRAVRFAAKLDFRIADDTLRAIRRYGPRLDRISGERVREELEKMLTGPRAGEAVARLDGLGLLKVVLAELYLPAERADLAIKRVAALAGHTDLTGMTAALLCGLSRTELRAVHRRWGASNAMRDAVIWLCDRLADWRKLPGASLAGLKRVRGHACWSQLAALVARGETADADARADWRAVRRRARAIDPERLAPDPLVSGDDLKRLGLSPGPRLGAVLRQVYEAQLNEQLHDRRQALRFARDLIGR